MKENELQIFSFFAAESVFFVNYVCESVLILKCMIVGETGMFEAYNKCVS